MKTEWTNQDRRLVAGLVVLFLVPLVVGVAIPSPRVLLMAGGFAVGGGLGFLYSAFGRRQSERFGPILAAIAAALAGVTLTQLQSPDSAVNRFVLMLAISSGFGENGSPLAGCTAFAAALPGFFTLYVFGTLWLSPRVADELGKIDDQDDRRDAARKALQSPSRTDGVMLAQPKPEEVRQAAASLERPGAGVTGTAEQLRADAQNLLLTNQVDRAEQALEQVVKLSPTPDAKVELAKVFIRKQEYGRAFELLSEVMTDNPPDIARKLFGHVALWAEGPERRTNLERGVAASESYLLQYPDDFGAVLNLACAFGQLAEFDPAFAPKAIVQLRRLKASAPELLRKARDLVGEGLDFHALRNNAEFRDLVGLPAALPVPPILSPRSETAMTIDYSLPAGAGPSPLIVVLHGTRGLNAPFGSGIQAAAQNLVAAGFAVAVPHYFERFGLTAATTPPDDVALIEAFNVNPQAFLKTIDSTITDAGTNPKIDTSRVSLLGYSLGGHLALLRATTGGIRAVVDFFAPLASLPTSDTIRAAVATLPPIQIHHGTADAIPIQGSRDLHAALRASGRTGDELHEYAGEPHGFTNPAAIADSQQRTQRFFTAHGQ